MSTALHVGIFYVCGDDVASVSTKFLIVSS